MRGWEGDWEEQMGLLWGPRPSRPAPAPSQGPRVPPNTSSLFSLPFCQGAPSAPSTQAFALPDRASMQVNVPYPGL